MRKNKKGTSTLFLAIILSALILVESTYIAFVADLDRRLTYTRALKEQSEIYLASYDRQLFKTYGIYAFNKANLNSIVFDEILAANGYENGDVMYVSGMYAIDTEVLRHSVAVFYTYRASGIIFQRFRSQIIALIDQLGDGVVGTLREYISSPSSGILGRIIDGGAEVAEAISNAASALGLDESSGTVTYITDLISTVSSLSHEAPDIGNGFDPSDMGFIINLLELNEAFYDLGADFNETFNFHACLYDYAANNFDCMLEEDTSINGTSFQAFHEDNESDCEYILTGLTGFSARALTDMYIYSVLFLRSFVINYTDPSISETVTAAAELLSAVVSALSAGTVTLPPQVYQLIIVILLSEIDAVIDLRTVLTGGEITFFSIGDIDAITVDYRDFLTMFMCFVPDNTILSRIKTIFDRDFPDYIVGIDTETDYRGRTITYEAQYEFYQ